MLILLIFPLFVEVIKVLTIETKLYANQCFIVFVSSYLYLQNGLTSDKIEILVGIVTLVGHNAMPTLTYYRRKYAYNQLIFSII